MKGNNAYLWNVRSDPQGEMIIGGLQTNVKRVTILGGGQELAFRQLPLQLFIEKIPPARQADPIAHTPVFKVEFDAEPRQAIGMSCSGKRVCLGGDAAQAAAAANEGNA